MGRQILRMSPSGDAVTGLQAVGYSFPEGVVEGDPIEKAHVFLDRALGSVGIGIWESAAGTVRFEAYPFDELCFLVEGELSLLGADGVSESFRGGDVFLVPKGWAGDWKMHRSVRKYYVELKD